MSLDLKLETGIFTFFKGEKKERKVTQPLTFFLLMHYKKGRKKNFTLNMQCAFQEKDFYHCTYVL